MNRLIDLLFFFWKRFRGPMQWRLLWLTQPKFMVNVAGVVFDHSGRVLLLKHRRWVPDVWGLPGGILERGETVEAGFARELLEETGLQLQDVSIVEVRSGFRLRIEFYLTGTIIGASTLSLDAGEISDGRFFETDHLPAEMLPRHRALITRADPASFRPARDSDAAENGPAHS